MSLPLLALGFGLFQAPVRLHATEAPSEARLAVAADSRSFAVFAPSGDDGRWALTVFGEGGEGILAWRPQGEVIRPLDVFIQGEDVFLATWPQGLYRVSVADRALVKKVPGNHDVFRHYPLMGGKWAPGATFFALSREFDPQERAFSGRLLSLDMEEFDPDPEPVITIESDPEPVPGLGGAMPRPPEGDLVAGLSLYPIEGEAALGCFQFVAPDFLYLCQFDKVVVYRREGERYVSRGQRDLPGVAVDVAVLETGRLAALAEDGSALYLGWTGFEGASTLSAGEIALEAGADCVEPALLDVATNGSAIWALLSCPLAGEAWAVPVP